MLREAVQVKILPMPKLYTCQPKTNDMTGYVVYQNTHIVGRSNSLFYTPVGNKVTLGTKLDSGSMACTISEMAELKLIDAGVVGVKSQFNSDVVLVGCGGRLVRPKSAFNINIEVYGCKMVVPTSGVEGQHDELILETKVIKHILRVSKQCDNYWKAVSAPCITDDTESEQFLNMLAGINHWRGDNISNKIGRVRCNSAICLDRGHEYLVRGKLNKN